MTASVSRVVLLVVGAEVPRWMHLPASPIHPILIPRLRRMRDRRWRAEALDRWMEQVWADAPVVVVEALWLVRSNSHSR